MHRTPCFTLAVALAVAPALAGCAAGDPPLPISDDIDACTLRYFPPTTVVELASERGDELEWTKNEIRLFRDLGAVQIAVTSPDGTWRQGSTGIFTALHFGPPDEDTDFSVDTREAVIDSIAHSADALDLRYHLPAGYPVGYEATSDDPACVESGGDAPLEGQCTCRYQSSEPLPVHLMLHPS
jgi:hypothetical protein